ncbi:ABC transporter permease [Mucilaginibacter aquariorum]|uniref:ABC transporter permease n=1 Tax=Mucilaginibacter aquariorum TaxID=2967225 RepID=A0ABT1TAB6_9SPHI|nr:ABC transporter permease [Mucilaginibacter aquariorum]MCQ6960893.1 ABC transporter permease [Mucilaginibacter aquariorum]
MLKNFLKTAFRSLLKNKGFTFINVLGLALGLTICLLIVFYVVDELSYDRFNTKYDRIYRVNTDLKYGGTTTSFAIAAPPVASALAKEFPEVESSARLSAAINIRFKKNDEIIEEKTVFYCDPTIFSILSLPLMEGDTKTALAEPNSIVISKSAALKYFSTTNAVGKTISMVTDSTAYKVTGVMEDMPRQSHFKADFFLALAPNHDNSWAHFSFNTYILLKAGSDHKLLEGKFDALARRNMNTEAFNYDKFVAKGNYIKLNLTPLKDIHLQSNRQRELGVNGDIQYIYIFLAIAIFILILACINFMNLSTARSANRAREVGVRKILGSPRKYLIAQFLSESVLVTIIATVIAVLAAWALLPLFNQMSGKNLVITTQTFMWLLPSLLIIVAVVGILAGGYPAFFLSAFQPIDVLKGKLSAGFKGSTLRSFLVVFQFSISIFLIISTLVVYNQLAYIKNKDLGFNRNQVLIVKNAGALANPQTLKQEVKQLPEVIDATLSSFLPTGTLRWTNTLSAISGKSVQTEFWRVDKDYLNTMGMKLVQGRNFSDQFLTDSSALIINETAGKMLGYNGDPSEKIININREYHIIGVVKDFNFNSLKDNVTPLVMTMTSDDMASLSIKISTGNLSALMNKLENKWKALAPNQQFEYSFMDEDFNAMYNNEQRMGKLFLIFTTLAVVIASLGLFSLAAYAAEQRNKEIGIRKVLGASVSAIVGMLSKDFIKLVLISFIIAAPLAWLAMHKWLEGFAYRQNMQWWVVAIAGIGAVVIAFATISTQSFKAAVANPADSLKSE